jgi:outer membrane protein assembly factor BamD (BamD/ComL family)
VNIVLRLAVASVASAALSLAPFQCGHDPDPNVRREDTAGDALWALAQDFRARHDEAAAKDTLKFLIEKYPSSRHTPAAKEELAALSGSAGSVTPNADGGP